MVLLFGCGGSPKREAEPPRNHEASQAAELAPAETPEEKELREAQAAAAQAVAEANAAKAKVDAIEKELFDLNARLDEAVEEVNNAENNAEVQRAKASLESLRKEQA